MTPERHSATPTRRPPAQSPGPFIALSEPNIGGHEWAYVKQCLDTGWVSSAGAFVDRFEREFAATVGARHAVAVASGTASLHLALLACGIGPNEEVVLPTLTFIAPANAVRYVGAWPVFVDVQPDCWQMDPAQLEAFLRDECDRGPTGCVNRRTGRRVSAVLPVDILGHPCDLKPIQGIASAYGLKIIEDATESLGARYRGRPLGSSSPFVCFSFNGNKLLTTGGGGMFVTDDEQIARNVRYLSTQAKDDPLEFVHGAIGYNYRLTNVQAAIGCAQLERIAEFVARKRHIAERYAKELGGLAGLQPMPEAPWADSCYWMYTVLVDAAQFGLGSRHLLRALEATNIQTRPLWQPLHLSPAHRGSPARSCPVAERIHREALSLPCSTGLTDEQQDRVIAAIRDAHSRPEARRRTGPEERIA